MKQTKIKSIQNGLLKNLTNLEILRLDLNEIVNIEINSFDPFDKSKRIEFLFK